MVSIFVGQRVRVKWVESRENLFLVGMSGRVTEKREFDGEETIYGLDISRIEKVLKKGQVFHIGFFSEQLEPILPEGAQPSEFSFTELMDNLGVVVA